jgi:hypothetical protein
MEYDQTKVDEAVLALLYLNFFEHGGVNRTWKGFDWDSMNRLHEKGYIGDPKSKAKSVVITEEGESASEAMFTKHFAV